MATAATSTSGNVSKYRRALTNLGLAAVVIVTPATVALSIALPDSWMTAVAWGAAVDVSIVLAGVIAGNRMVAGEPAKSQEKPAKKRKPADTEQVQPATIPLEPAISQPQPAFVCSCGFSAKSQPALNAHQRKHKQIIGYAVSMEPIKAEKKQ